MFSRLGKSIIFAALRLHFNGLVIAALLPLKLEVGFVGIKFHTFTPLKLNLMKLKHLWDYLQERFPLINMLLFGVLYLTVYSVSQAPAMVWYFHLWGLIACLSFFFRLRVFDEIKDFKQDALNHPTRVLQSGRIDLMTLIRLSLIFSILELAWSYQTGAVGFGAWFVAFAYAWAMRFEFGLGAFLRPRLWLYSLSHMLVMPLIIAWLWLALGGKDYHHLALLAGLSLCAGFSFELARKLHAPDAERSGIDSYSKSLGLPLSLGLIIACLALGLVLQFFLLSMNAMPWWPLYLLAACSLLVLLLYFRHGLHWCESQLRQAEKGVSLYMIMGYLGLSLAFLNS